MRAYMNTCGISFDFRFTTSQRNRDEAWGWTELVVKHLTSGILHPTWASQAIRSLSKAERQALPQTLARKQGNFLLRI